MARVLEITVPAERSAKLINDLQANEAVVSLRVHRGVSLRPQGDVIAVEITNRAYHSLLKTLADQEIGATSASGLTASEPTAIYSRPFAEALLMDSSEASLEEVEVSLATEGNMTANGLALMLCGGTLATLGLARGAVELVIAGMVISPGFECITRVGLGIACASGAARRGLAEMSKAYAALIVGALVTSVILKGMGIPLLHGGETYVVSSALVQHWSSLNSTAVWSSATAAIAGVVLTAAHRSILTAGAMIALGLVPAGALVAMALVAGDFAFAGKALARWIVEVTLVTGISTLIFSWKRRRVHRRTVPISDHHPTTR